MMPVLSEYIIIGTIILLTIIITFNLYCYNYFNSEKFKKLKSSIIDHVNNCNDMNNHIEQLKSSYVNIKSVKTGQGELTDNSKFNFKRIKWKDFNSNKNVHNCSASVVNNVKNNPMKYLCKYFNIKTDEASLNNIEEVLNSFSAAEQGKLLLIAERDKIVKAISEQIPSIILAFANDKLVRKLGFKLIDVSNLYFPVYKFQYISTGGNSKIEYNITLNISNLENLINYLGGLIKFRKSVQGQRALMTSILRDQIKKRDAYTCQSCGNSTNNEPNLLLEIDHIHPISKGGITSVENLQTLCWKCNRSKGAKVISK